MILQKMYSALKPILFTLDAEFAHKIVLSLLNRFNFLIKDQLICNPVKVGVIELLNPVGIAAGIDKNGDYLDLWFKLGAGFVCVGTVTPKPQSGNPKPRLYRLPKYRSIVNKMGFNNEGVVAVVKKIEKHSNRKGIIGLSIGKGAETPLEEAYKDYEYCAKMALNVADFIEVNISSPNTPGLRNLHSKDFLAKIIDKVKNVMERSPVKRALFLKVSPDLSQKILEEFADVSNFFVPDAIVISNTTICSGGYSFPIEGGISGALLRGRSLAVQLFLSKLLDKKISIIASGGILTPEDALWRKKAGASAVYLFTGLIYYGPELINDILRVWKKKNV